MDTRDIWVGDNWLLQKELIGTSEAPGYCKYLEELAQQPYYRPVRLEYHSQLYNGEGNAKHNDIKVACSWLDCNCYPFACFCCKICKELWWVHCKKGRAPRSVCQPCWEEQRELTALVLNQKVAARELKVGSPLWWQIYSKGVNPDLYCYHPNEPSGPFKTDIVSVKCRKQVKELRCDIPPLKDKNWHSKRKWERGVSSAPEEYPCCREDGTPRS